ncbi:MAG: hypothetical protein M1378_07920 [Bacteroidetes bacterium]|nr:hypothetical protein [Bacteroidota bacterium]
MEARQTTSNPDFYVETLELHPDTVLLNGQTWYSFRGYAKKRRMPYSTVVTWAARKKLSSKVINGYKYVADEKSSNSIS